MTLLWPHKQQLFFTHSSPNAAEFSSAVVQKINKEKGFFYLQQSLVSVLALMATRAAKTGSGQTQAIVCVFVCAFFPTSSFASHSTAAGNVRVQMRGEGAWTDLFSGSLPRSRGVKLNDRRDLNTRRTSHTDVRPSMQSSLLTEPGRGFKYAPDVTTEFHQLLKYFLPASFNKTSSTLMILCGIIQLLERTNVKSFNFDHNTVDG